MGAGLYREEDVPRGVGIPGFKSAMDSTGQPKASPPPVLPAEPRILVVKLSSLGDLFHALPAVHALKTGLGARIDWVTQPAYVEVVRCFRDVERVIAFPRNSFFRSLPSFLGELRRERYDAAIDFQGLVKSGLVVRLARAGMRIGPSFHREGARVFYSAVAGPRDKCRHAVVENLDVVRFFGLPMGEPEFDLGFPQRALSGAPPRVALLPVSRWPTKNWPRESFAEVARRLRSQAGASVFLLGGPDDVDACAEIERLAGVPVVNLAGTLSLAETGGVLQQMQLLVTNDSGPMHMAAAAGTPVLALFGPTDPKRTGPFGPRHKVILLSLPCQPCFQRACRHGDVRCLAGISPDQVTDAAMVMLGRR